MARMRSLGEIGPPPFSYEVVLVKACEAHAFVFIFAASDVESANRLIGETTVKLDLKRSGCGGAALGTPQKK